MQSLNNTSGRRGKVVAWIILIVCAIYLFLPLITQFDYSLRMRRDTLSFDAYYSVLTTNPDEDATGIPRFYTALAFSSLMALLTIVVSVVIVVPTAYWVHMRSPRIKPVIEFITILPFAIPGIVLIFGYLRTYSAPPFALTNTEVGTAVLLVGGYSIGVMPFIYRTVDTGLRAIDIKSLTEAARNLGAGWGTVIFRVIMPNLRVAILSSALLTYAVAIGEYTLSNYLFPDGRTFGSYIYAVGSNRIFEPAALTIISYGLVWILVLLIQRVGRGPGQTQVAGMR